MNGELDITIFDLDLSQRAIMTLMRNGVRTLDDILNLETEYGEWPEWAQKNKVSEELRCISEQKEIIWAKQKVFRERLDQVDDEIMSLNLYQLGLPSRIQMVLDRVNVHTVGQLLKLTREQLFNIAGLTIREGKNLYTVQAYILEHSQQELKPFILKEPGDKGTSATIWIMAVKGGPVERVPSLKPKQAPSQNEELAGPGFDYGVLNTMTEFGEDYKEWLYDWVQPILMSSYDYALRYHPKKYLAVWTGKPLLEAEEKAMRMLAEEKILSQDADGFHCRIVNDRKSRFLFLIGYPGEIKCFFPEELPEDLCIAVQNSGLDRVSQPELDMVKAGRVVYILRKKRFQPADMAQLQRLASLRGIQPAKLVYRLTHMLPVEPGSYTDEEIIKILQSKSIYGKVFLLSSDKQANAIRAFSKRVGLTVSNLVKLYGMVYGGAENQLAALREEEELKIALKAAAGPDSTQVELDNNSELFQRCKQMASARGKSIQNLLEQMGYRMKPPLPEPESKPKPAPAKARSDTNEAEQDMQTWEPGEKPSLVRKVFAHYPLLGEWEPTADTKEKLYEKAVQVISRKLKHKWKYNISMEGNALISLAVINAAKNWSRESSQASDSIGDNAFWTYIAMEMGLRDQENSVREIFYQALEQALRFYNRFFITSGREREYMITVLVHAMSPAAGWYALLDLMNQFYLRNLRGRYISGDPLVGQMVRVLKGKLEGTLTGNDDLLQATSGSYHLPGSVRWLICARPQYTVSLFSRMLDCVDQLQRTGTCRQKNRLGQLCTGWYRARLARLSEMRPPERSSTPSKGVRETVFQYSGIRPKYQLGESGTLSLVFPDVRLEQGVSRVVLTVSYPGGSEHRRLDIFGDELGRTSIGCELELPANCLTSQGIQVALDMACDGQSVYRSETTLYRRALFFDGSREVRPASLQPGGYVLLAPVEGKLNAECAELTLSVQPENRGLRMYWAQLEQDFFLELDGVALASNRSQADGITVVPPKSMDPLPELEMSGESCRLARPDDVCCILLSNLNLRRRYVVFRNGQKLEYGSKALAMGRRPMSFLCRMEPQGEARTCCIHVVDTLTNHVRYYQKFVVVNGFSCRFNRPYYYTPEDYRDAYLEVVLEGQTNTAPFGREDAFVELPFRGGALRVPTPRVELRLSDGHILDGTGQVLRFQDLGQQSTLNVSCPAGVQVKLTLAGEPLTCAPNGDVALGNAVMARTPADGRPDVNLGLELKAGEDTHKCHVARIFSRDGFLKEPEFWYEPGRLCWDRGGAWVGDTECVFQLALTPVAGGNRVKLDLPADAGWLDLPKGMESSLYRWDLYLKSVSKFRRSEQKLACGVCGIGDEDTIRFSCQKVILDMVTLGEDAENGKHTQICRCYIQDIRFLGREEVEEGVILPVYQGTLTTKDNAGRPYVFATQSGHGKDGVERSAVNPVLFAPFNDRVLSMVEAGDGSFQDRDGFYVKVYHGPSGSPTAYTLTDEVCLEQTSSETFLLADLYLYSTALVLSDSK